MLVLNLACDAGHGFEGWFASAEDFASQTESGLLSCPLCGNGQIRRMPSAPRLNVSHLKGEPANPSAQPPAPLQTRLRQALQAVIAQTEDVGSQFAEQARRIHYGEAPERGIRGQATAAERAELQDEGIAVLALPLLPGLDGPLQ